MSLPISGLSRPSNNSGQTGKISVPDTRWGASSLEKEAYELAKAKNSHCTTLAAKGELNKIQAFYTKCKESSNSAAALTEIKTKYLSIIHERERGLLAWVEKKEIEKTWSDLEEAYPKTTGCCNRIGGKVKEATKSYVFRTRRSVSDWTNKHPIPGQALKACAWVGGGLFGLACSLVGKIAKTTFPKVSPPIKEMGTITLHWLVDTRNRTTIVAELGKGIALTASAWLTNTLVSEPKWTKANTTALACLSAGAAMIWGSSVYKNRQLEAARAVAAAAKAAAEAKEAEEEEKKPRFFALVAGPGVANRQAAVPHVAEAPPSPVQGIWVRNDLLVGDVEMRSIELRRPPSPRANNQLEAAPPAAEAPNLQAAPHAAEAPNPPNREGAGRRRGRVQPLAQFAGTPFANEFSMLGRE